MKSDAQKTKSHFIKDRVGELRNVTWPTQNQAVHSMILVLSIMLIVGVFLGVVDNIINFGVSFLLNFA